MKLMAQNPIMMISSEKKIALFNLFLSEIKKIKGISTLICLLFVPIYIAFFSSCANQGQGPSGGPRDSIPPIVLSSIPAPYQTMFSGKEIVVTFNEYVVPDNLSQKLVFSPPLAKKPEISIKGKSCIIKIEEDLIPDRTYSIDFQDGIKDYTEGNKLKELRLVFSTGAQLDTLRIGGNILDAFTLAPTENVLATLYSFDNDSVFQNLRPDFIAPANEEGSFLFNNLPHGQYKLYGLVDADKNLYYSQATELIAFSDSMISPSARFIAQPDTVISEKDTVITKGHTVYSPENLTLLLFEEKVYSQYIVSFKRDPNDKCLIVFSEPVTDSLNIGLLDSLVPEPWNIIEVSNNQDSVTVFITDSVVTKTDTLFFKIKYTATDSLGNFITKTDTLKMLQSKPVKAKTKKKDDTPADNMFFKFSTNLVSSNFDLNKNVIIEAPSPIVKLDKELIGLNEIINDSTQKPVNFELQSIERSIRKFQLICKLNENTKYQLSIDTSAVKTLTGTPNAGFKTKFSTQKADYYGSIILSLSGIDGKGKILLLKYNEKSDKEEVVREISVESIQKDVVFDYLKPEKYILKYYADLNNNGKWDTGNLSLDLQPEPVTYFQKVISVKSNWEIKENWKIDAGVPHEKKIVDESKEEKKSGKK